jgi:hypothetical protein
MNYSEVGSEIVYQDIVYEVSKEMLGGDRQEIILTLHEEFGAYGLEIDQDNIEIVADNISKGIEQPPDHVQIL